MKNKLKQISIAGYFLLIVIIIYIITAIIKPELIASSLKFFFSLLKKIIPIFILVFVLMALTNYFIEPKKLTEYFKKQKGIKIWLIAIVGGILSSGPIYMWYPLLADLKNKGLDYGLIACFLYNRAIKIPLLPLMIFYFSIKYVLILSFVMIFISIFQGILINKLISWKKNESRNSI